MTFKNTFALQLSLCLGLVACAPGTALNVSTPNSAGIEAQATPDKISKANTLSASSDVSRLQSTTKATGKLKGKIILPGLIKPAQVASNNFGLMAYFTGMPAHAEELELTQEDLENLQATVNGEEVEITVTDVNVNEESDQTEVTYEIEEAPATDGQEVLEIQTEDGTPLAGAITDVEEGETTEQDVDEESTSFLEKAEYIHGKHKIGQLTQADFDALKIDATKVNPNASLRSILRKDGTLKPNKARKLALPECVAESETEEDGFETQAAKGKSNAKASKTPPGLAKKQATQSTTTSTSHEDDDTEETQTGCNIPDDGTDTGTESEADASANV